MARIRFGIIITAFAVIGLSIPPAGQAAEPQATKGPEEVNFAISCGPEAQKPLLKVSCRVQLLGRGCQDVETHRRIAQWSVRSPYKGLILVRLQVRRL